MLPKVTWPATICKDTFTSDHMIVEVNVNKVEVFLELLKDHNVWKGLVNFFLFDQLYIYIYILYYKVV